jgi:hypothetical protein
MNAGQGRFEVYIVSYDEHRQPTYIPYGVPKLTFEQAKAAAKELELHGKLWEIVETTRRLIDFSDRVPDRRTLLIRREGPKAP